MNFSIGKCDKNFGKTIIYFSFCVAVIYSCHRKETVTIEENYPDGKLMMSCEIDTSQKRHDTLYKTVYYPNGNIKIKGSYNNNLRQGIWQYYYSNGTLWSKGTFKNGKSEGVFTIYNEDGTLYIQSSYQNGIPEGLWSFYDKGKKIKEVTFKNNTIIKTVNF